MEKILTIVIPTYNMQDYLRRCLDSLIVPEEQMQLLEVLVVNDGSKDNSSAIAHEYQDKYPDTFRVIDKENGNYGSCVNRGLKEATGKYIKILDADDWFDNEQFSLFVEKLKKYDCDLILSPFVKVNEKLKSVQKITIPLQKGVILSARELSRLPNVEMHAITYRVELLRSMCYVQTEGISYTDTEWDVLPLQNVGNFVVLEESVYEYLIGREGQTINLRSVIKGQKQLEQILTRIISEYTKSKYIEVDNFVKNKVVKTIDYLYHIVLIYGKENDIEILKSFDDFMKHSCYYELSDKLLLDNRIPWQYIHWWRTHSYKRLKGQSFMYLYNLLMFYRKIKFLGNKAG